MKKHQKVSGYLIGMIILGAIGLSFVGWLVEYRTGRPLEITDDTAIPENERNPLDLLAAGGSQTAAQARLYLVQGERAKATQTMDAAMRVAEVGAHVAEGQEGIRFQRALNAIKDGRHALQMGDSDQAVEHLSQSADVLGQVLSSGPTQQLASSRWSAFEGAQLINAQGARIGELERIQEGPDRGAEVLVTIGGMQDFLGFLDFGGRQLVIPVERMIFGRPRTIGATVVALPFFETSATAIAEILSLPYRSRG